MAIKAVIGKDGKEDTLTNKNSKSGLTIMAGKSGDDTYIVNNISKNWTVINDKDEEEDLTPADPNNKLLVKNIDPKNSFLFFDVAIKNSDYNIQSKIDDGLYIINKGMTDPVLSQFKAFIQTGDFNKFSKGAIGVEYYFGDTNNWNGSEYGSTYGGGYINTIQISDSKGTVYTLDQHSYINDVREQVSEYLKNTLYKTVLELLNNCEDSKIVNELIDIYKNATLKFTDITGSSKANTIYANDGDTYINGAKGDDIIYAGEGTKTITIYNDHGNDTIYLGENSTSKVYLNINSSNISYGKGVNENENDLYIYSQYETVVKKKTVTKTQTTTIKNYFTKNSQLFLNDTEIDNSYLSTFDIKLQGISNKNNTLTGFDNFNETFIGGKKSDTIYTGTGNNTAITGKKGSTEINSCEGDDTFIVNNLKTYTNINDLGGTDNLQINSVSANDITLYYDIDNDELRISQKDSISNANKNNITINNYNNAGKIEQIHIADKKGNNIKTIDAEQWVSDIETIVTEYIDTKGYNTLGDLMNSIKTMSSKNKKKALTEFYNLFLTYKRGSDGDDKIVGTAGNDTLYGENGNDKIKGGKGNDYIVGGKGNDKLYGEKGSNTFEFNIGDGNDTIYKSTKSDILKFNDIKFEDMKFSKQGDNLVIENEFGDSITLKSFFNSKNKINTLYEKDNPEGISILENAYINVTGKKTVKGTDYNDIISGSSNNDKLYGYKGNNTFIFDVGSSSDTIYSGKGTDTIQINNYSSISDFKNNVTMTSSGNSLIIKYSDSDKITIDNYFKNSSVKYIKIGEETEELSTIISSYAQNHVNEIDKSSNTKNNINITGTQFNDEIIGSDKSDTIKSLAGDDKIYAGRGNDSIYAGTGKNEIYIYEGDGNDTIYTNGGGEDILVLPDRYAEMIYWYKAKNNLVFTFLNTNDKITLADFFKGSPSNPSLTTVRFANNKEKSLIDIIQGVEVVGSGKIKGTIVGDNITGSNKADIIYGYSGDDNIYSFSGKDTIYGGDGNDIIVPGSGNNYIDAGDGDDTISANFGGYDIVSRDVIYAGKGNDRINLGVSWNEVHGGEGNDDIDCGFATAAKFHKIYGDEGNDSIYVSGSNHYIDGGDDKDYIEGTLTDSTIIGGKGNDTFNIEGSGNTFEFSTDDGDDIISGGSALSNAVIFFKEEQSLSFSRESFHNLIVSYGNGDRIELLGYFTLNDDDYYTYYHPVTIKNGNQTLDLHETAVAYMTGNNQNNTNSLSMNIAQLNSDIVNWNTNTSSEGAEIFTNNQNNDGVNELIAQYSYDNASNL